MWPTLPLAHVQPLQRSQLNVFRGAMQVCVDRAYLSKTMKMERSHYMGPEELAIAGMM